MELITTRTTTLLFILVFLSSCSSHTPTPVMRRNSLPPKYIPKDTHQNKRTAPTQKPYKIRGKTYYPIPNSEGFEQTGIASWYGSDFHGRKTSNGETYDMYELTAAHKTLPMNTFLLVKNLDNNREMTVRINDRGPFHKGRIIDMSKTGANNLGFIEQGTAKVKIIALGEATRSRRGGKETTKFKQHPDFQSGDFFIQIGSFTEKSNASRLKDRMAKAGRTSVIQKFDRGDLIFFRVQVEAGINLGAAERLAKNLNENGFPDAFVVAR